jgi:hypothetical protein
MTATQLRRASLFASAVDHVMATAPIMAPSCSPVLIAVPGDDDHDVADLLLGLQVPVRVDDLLERVGAVDNGCELPGLDQPLEVLDRLLVDPREWNSTRRPREKRVASTSSGFCDSGPSRSRSRSLGT